MCKDKDKHTAWLIHRGVLAPGSWDPERKMIRLDKWGVSQP